MREVLFMDFVRLKLAGVAALGLVLSACQSGDTLGALKIGGSGQADRQDGRETITTSELLAYCPSITLAGGDAVLNRYQRGGDGDADRLVFRAAISDTTRSCSYDGGTMAMTIGIAGRVIPGPAGSAGTVRLPLRIQVFQDTTEIHSQRIDHEIAVADTAGATQFMLVDRNFSMPNPTRRNVRVIVGFAEETGR